MSIVKPIGFWLSSRYENGIDESRKPMVIAPVSLIFLSVPVSSSALACPAQKLAASASPITCRRFISWSSPLDDFRNACKNRAGIVECSFRPPTPQAHTSQGSHLLAHTSQAHATTAPSHEPGNSHIAV